MFELRSASLWVCLASAALLPNLAGAQSIPRDLGDPTAVFPEPFSRIVGLRELSDGRILIADQLEQRVSFVDFARGTLDQVGRRGGGPGEYQSPRGLLPFSNDGSLLLDFGNMRMTRVESNGRLADSWPLISRGGGIQIVLPTAADTAGHVYHSSAGQFNFQMGGPTPELPDSEPVLRWNLTANTTDTVAMLYAPSGVTTTSGGRGGGFSFNTAGGARITSFQQRPFQPRDTWAVAADGRLAVVRANEYRVDWYQPNGGPATRGPVVEYDPIRIDDAEKNAWADRQANRQMTMRMIGGSGGGGSRQMQAPRPDVDAIDFPEFKPPFGENTAVVTPEGQVWVMRSQRHDYTDTWYDVFDRRGTRVRQVRLSNRRRVVGFGRGVVYVVVSDDDDLQWLERYRQ